MAPHASAIMTERNALFSKRADLQTRTEEDIRAWRLGEALDKIRRADDAASRDNRRRSLSEVRSELTTNAPDSLRSPSRSAWLVQHNCRQLAQLDGTSDDWQSTGADDDALPIATHSAGAAQNSRTWGQDTKHLNTNETAAKDASDTGPDEKEEISTVRESANIRPADNTNFRDRHSDKRVNAADRTKPADFNRKCRLCSQMGHLRVNCPLWQLPRCNNCREFGHVVSACPQPTFAIPTVCRVCHERGHKASTCPVRKAKYEKKEAGELEFGIETSDASQSADSQLKGPQPAASSPAASQPAASQTSTYEMEDDKTGSQWRDEKGDVRTESQWWNETEDGKKEGQWGNETEGVNWGGW